MQRQRVTSEVYADADAVGVSMNFGDFGLNTGDTAQPVVTAAIDNSGHIDVVATALAGGGDVNNAYATAAGISIFAGGDANRRTPFSTSMSSTAVPASACSPAPKPMAMAVPMAYAAGISVNGGVVTGSIDNLGLIQVTAAAVGGGAYAGTEDQDGVGYAGALCHRYRSRRRFLRGSDQRQRRHDHRGRQRRDRIGLRHPGGGADISARVHRDRRGGTGTAYTTGYVPPSFAGTAVGQINLEDATIWAGISNDGGLSIDRGIAIDVSSAPNAMVINLDGLVDIYGNILLSDDDIVNVNGQVYFDGVVNPGGYTATTGGLYPDALGVLNVAGGATLTIANNGDDGPAFVNVAQFNQADTGTVVFEVRGIDGSDAEESAGSIFASGAANLDGTAVVRLLTGLYDDFDVSKASLWPAR